MATMQVRELPEEVYEVLRLRARRAGQSTQLYMRDQLTALAGRPTKEESLLAIASVLARTAGGIRPRLPLSMTSSPSAVDIQEWLSSLMHQR